MKEKGGVVFITSDRIGRGDDELGQDLMLNFLHQLSECETKPDFVILMNGGVKLAVEGSEALASLEALEANAVTILACGTCLNFFGIKDKQRAGKPSNMVEITATMLNAKKVVTV